MLNGDTSLFVPCLFIWGFALLMWALFLYPKVQEIAVTKPEIHISSTNVKVGEHIVLNYSQRFKRDVDVNGLKFQLILRETAIYRRGTDTVTVTHDNIINEFVLEGRTFNKDHVLTDQWDIEIPADGMHTFKASRNRLQWYIRIKLDIKGWIDFVRDYEITVVPMSAL